MEGRGGEGRGGEGRGGEGRGGEGRGGEGKGGEGSGGEWRGRYLQTIQPGLRVFDCSTNPKEVWVLGLEMTTLLRPWGIRGSLSSGGRYEA